MKKLLLATLALLPSIAFAFCGFYVGGGNAKLFNNATQVVLMRDETRVVLSMQNNYQGPPENFAMVVPVPVVLKKEDVLTLDPALFTRVEQLDAPRLVEYWEQDPCNPYANLERLKPSPPMMDASGPGLMKSTKSKDYGVTIEAQFNVAEYEVVVLSARESTGLNDWLVDNKYNIPKDAAPVLKPYISAGLKFFVAKVDSKKVKFNADGQAMLSPLRFHYDAETFFLPVRLGLLNASDYQDLIVHILAKDRYEAANFNNVTIPTNINVVEAVNEEFGPFYVALFDEVLKKNPGSIVTEYSWQANGCDPCPIPPLAANDLVSLGADVIPGTKSLVKGADTWSIQSYFVLTRLHARYNKDSLGEDIIFRKADPIVGGREFNGADGTLETGAKTDSINNFQGRYIIRHPWNGPITCDNPTRNIWGGPPNSYSDKPITKPAQNLAFAKRGKELSSFLPAGSVELKSYTAGATISMKELPQVKGKRARSCAIDTPGSSDSTLWLFLFGAAGLLLWRRSHRSRD